MAKGAGEYRHLVEIQSASVSANGYGDQVTEWTTTATRWASIYATSGKEKERLQTRQAEAMYTLHFRRVEGLLPSARIRWQGRVFEIIEIIDDPTFCVDQIVKVAEKVQ